MPIPVMRLSLLAVLALATGLLHAAPQPPNIVAVLADDLGCRDLQQDLKETTNVAAEQPEITAAMRSAIEEFKEPVVPGT